MRRKPKTDPWYAWALVALAALIFTNAGWFYRWRLRAVEHAEALAEAQRPRKPQERVVYEYRGATPAHQQPQRTQQRQQATRDLVRGEECWGGVIIRRNAAGMESTGERCRN